MIKGFRDGYHAALYRYEPIIICSWNTHYEKAWMRGYARGKEVLEFHKDRLQRRCTFDHFNNLYGRKNAK